MKIDLEAIRELLTNIYAWITAAVLGVIAWWQNKNKSKVEIEALQIKNVQDLNSAYAKALDDLEKYFEGRIRSFEIRVKAQDKKIQDLLAELSLCKKSMHEQIKNYKDKL